MISGYSVIHIFLHLLVLTGIRGVKGAPSLIGTQHSLQSAKANAA